MNFIKSWRSRTLLILSANIFFICVGIFLVYHHKIWTDEGWYYNGAVLFSRGILPYVDFFYHRLPLHVEFYGTLFKLFGSSFIMGRVISLVLFINLINLTALCVYRITNSFFAVLISYAAFFNIEGLWGFLTISTYSLSSVLFILAL